MGTEIVAASEESGLDLDLLKRTVAKGTTDDEFALFAAVCRRTGLDPFARQIYAVSRWDNRAGRNVMQTQISIDGGRLTAQRSGHYSGQLGPYWCGKDGVWVDVWLADEHPAAARVAVLRNDFSEPMWGVARWESYVQTSTKDGKTTVGKMWKQMGDVMIAKCAEMLALRKAFPMELSGLYSAEEMSQAEDVVPVAVAEPPAVTAPAQPARATTTRTTRPPPGRVAPAEPDPANWSVDLVNGEILDAEVVEDEIAEGAPSRAGVDACEASAAGTALSTPEVVAPPPAATSGPVESYEAPNPMTEPQFRKAKAILRSAKITEDEDVYSAISGAMGRPVSDFKQVDKAEVDDLFKALGAIPA